MEEIKQKFTTAFIQAIAENSAQKLYPLCNSYQDMKKYDTELGFTEEKLSEIVLSNCSKFIDTIDFDITEYILESSTLDGAGDSVEIVKSHFVTFAKSLILSFVKKEAKTKLKIDIGHPIIIDDQLKINNPLLIEFRQYEPYIKPESILVLDNQNKSHELPLCQRERIKSALDENNIFIEGCPLELDWYIHDGDLELDSFDFEKHIIVTGDLSVHEPLTNINVSLIVLGKTTVNALSILDDGDEVFLLGGVNFNIAILINSSGSQIELKNLSGPMVDIISETTNIGGDMQVKYFNYPENDESHGDIESLIKEKYFYDEEGISEIDSYAIMDDIKHGAEIFKNADDKETFVEVNLPDLQDRVTIISLLKEDGLYLKNLDKKFKSDKELIHIATDKTTEAFKYIAENLKQDKAYIYDMVKKNGRIFEFVNEDFKKDKELVLLAINSSPYALDDAHESLKSDKEVVLLAVSKNARVLEYADESLQADEDILLAVINNDVDGFKYASESAADNRNIMLALVKKAPKYLSVPPLKKYLNDRKFLMEILTENHSVFNHLPDKLQNDKEFREIAGRV